MTGKTRVGIFMAVLIVGVLMMATPARAQGAGIQAGVSADPDQFYFGGHLEYGPVVDKVLFRPSAEIGLGDNATVVALNLEFAYKTPLPQTSSWDIYFGGGPALNIVRVAGNTDPRGGFNLLVGAEHRNGLFTEIKIGLADSPSFKFGVGYNWH